MKTRWLSFSDKIWTIFTGSMTMLEIFRTPKFEYFFNGRFQGCAVRNPQVSGVCICITLNYGMV